MHVPWVSKYRPKSLAQVIGNKENIQKLVDWVRSWEKSLPKKRAAFIYGPPGVGKTVAVEALANDLGLELVEKNASDYRTEDAISKFAGLASQFGSLFGARRIVLLDELDGLTGTADKGGVKATTDIVKVSRRPIVLTANSAYETRFASLRKHCLLLEFKKPSFGDIAKRLQNICELEGVQADDDALKFVARRSGGDVRSAINDLQALAQGKMSLKYEDVTWLGHRDRQDSIFVVLKMIIYGKTCIGAKQAVSISDVDMDMLFEWIYENIPEHLTDPKDLMLAMDAISKADVYRGRIRSSQNWGLTRYVIDQMTAGVCMARQRSKSSGWTPFRFPSKILSLSRSKAERAMKLEIGRKIKRKCHTSAYSASRETLPFLAIIFKNDVNMAAGLAKWLNLDSEMIAYLAGDEDKAGAINKLIV